MPTFVIEHQARHATLAVKGLSSMICSCCYDVNMLRAIVAAYRKCWSLIMALLVLQSARDNWRAKGAHGRLISGTRNILVDYMVDQNARSRRLDVSRATSVYPVYDRTVVATYS